MVRAIDEAVFCVAVEHTDDEYGFVYRRANPSLRQQTGFSTDDFRGETPRAVFGEQQGEAIAKEYRRCVTSEESIEYEHSLSVPAGTVHWQTTLRPIRTDGDVSQIVGTARDIAERKAKERELTQFREAVEQTGHAVYITDSDGTIEYVNPAFEELTGYDATEAIGETPRILRSGEYDEAFYEDLWETIQSGERWEGEMVDEGADGKRIVFQQTISPLPDEDSDSRKFVAVARDVTERKAYERRLERARENLRRIIDLVPDLIFSKNRDGEYLLANEATARAYGTTPDELEGRREENVIPDVSDSEQFREDDREVIESGERKTIPEETLTTVDGETKVLQTTKIPYELPGSGEDAVLGYARDLTELKEYERTIERQRDTLEILNQMVRHDIRNHLQIVFAHTETLQDYVEEDGRRHVQRVLESARDAVEITRTSRDVTEAVLQSGADCFPVDLRHALEDEIEQARTSHEQALITVDGSIPDVEVVADDMLESVFRNLLHNAVTHNDEEIPEITVSTSLTGEAVVVRIADNGPGIPDDRKKLIFEEGEGLDSESTGLGLYLVRMLVDRYGGAVRVEDNEPEGSVFVVTIPRAA